MSTSPLCPDDVVCITNGTIIQLEVELESCVDSLGPVSYTFEETEAGLNLVVAASTLRSKNALVAFCSEGPYVANYTAQLIMVFVEKENINLIEVKRPDLKM